MQLLAYITFTSEDLARRVVPFFESFGKAHKFMNSQIQLSYVMQNINDQVLFNLKADKFSADNYNTSYSIFNVYYGNLLSGESMRNLIRKSIIYQPDRKGIIGYQLGLDANKRNFSIKFDLEKKTINIFATQFSSPAFGIEKSNTYQFQWGFRK